MDIKVHQVGRPVFLPRVQMLKLVQYVFAWFPSRRGFTTGIFVDGTHEEGNGNGNANARRPTSGKCLGKGTHPSRRAWCSWTARVLEYTISSLDNDDDRIGDTLLNDIETWNSRNNERKLRAAI